MKKFEQEDLKVLNVNILEDPDIKPDQRTVEGLLEISQELRNEVVGQDDPNMDGDGKEYFWNKVYNCLSDMNSIRLNDVQDEDVFQSIDRIMSTLHYDNGKPLTCDDYNYFDHYDRDQDKYDWVSFLTIDHFELTDSGDLVCVVDKTYDQLRSELRNEYEGSRYDHDFED